MSQAELPRHPATGARLRALAAWAPRPLRHALARRMLRLPAPQPGLRLKMAETRDELDACFRLQSPSTTAGAELPASAHLAFAALPSTTTLCAVWQRQVVGTVSLVRDGVFGLPSQPALAMSSLRARAHEEGGALAEVCQLAVAPAFRGHGLLWPLLSLLLAYAQRCTDLRLLVFAVPPQLDLLVDGLLQAERLPGGGLALLSLRDAAARTRRLYGGRPPQANLHHHLFERSQPGLELPEQPWFATQHPVMTPALLDHFFNQRSATFAQLDERRKALLWSVYPEAGYRAVLPRPADGAAAATEPLRRHARHALRAPAELRDGERRYVVQLVELSEGGCQVESSLPLPLSAELEAWVELGAQEHSHVRARVLRELGGGERRLTVYGLQLLGEADAAWRRCLEALSLPETALAR